MNWAFVALGPALRNARIDFIESAVLSTDYFSTVALRTTKMEAPGS
jgi:hypothetical protein